MADVVTFGEVMAMFVAAQQGPLDEVDRFGVRLAGAEMNVAVGLARLGHSVRYLGAVGADPFGTRIRRELAGEGLDLGEVITNPAAPTGFQLKNRVSYGDPEVVYFRKGSAAARLRWSRRAAAAVQSARYVHVTGIFAALSPETREFSFNAMRTAKRAGATVTFDPNLRPALWPNDDEMIETVNELAGHADCVLPGLAEGRLTTGRETAEGIAEFYRARGASQVVLKLGDAGAVLHGERGRVAEPAFAVDVVDTVGAGDGFAAGWISARLDGLDEASALRRACVVGALATTSEGDKDGLPTRSRLAELLETAA